MRLLYTILVITDAQQQMTTTDIIINTMVIQCFHATLITCKLFGQPHVKIIGGVKWPYYILFIMVIGYIMVETINNGQSHHHNATGHHLNMYNKQ